MTEFACSMQKIFIDTQNQLLPSLGDSLRALDIRIGFHCGKVTAGVLRSEKGRFQLFGDTVNVAARFEQNGIPGMIQVSEDVKNELIRYGLDTWLVERPEGIHAKGLGQLKAFWIVPEKVVGYDTIEIARTREEFKETS